MIPNHIQPKLCIVNGLRGCYHSPLSIPNDFQNGWSWSLDLYHTIDIYIYIIYVYIYIYLL